MKTKPIIDERNYSVVGINGYRQGNLTRSQADTHAAQLVHQMETAGWRGRVAIVYRDGTVVWTHQVGGK